MTCNLKLLFGNLGSGNPLANTAASLADQTAETAQNSPNPHSESKEFAAVSESKHQPPPSPPPFFGSAAVLNV